MVQNTDLIKSVIGTLFSDIAISQPLYCPDVKNELDGEQMSAKLPLVYIWNEDPSLGSCSISINGPIVGEVLENFLPRSDPNFIDLRDKILKTVRELAISSIMSTCEKLGVLPSVAFSKEVYLGMCTEASK